jgi:hypothetical protein
VRGVAVALEPLRLIVPLRCATAANQNLVCELGGLDLALKASVNFKDNAYVLDGLCQLLFNIAEEHGACDLAQCVSTGRAPCGVSASPLPVQTVTAR